MLVVNYNSNMNLNIKNVEEIIFFDKKIQNLLPEQSHFFEQWKLGKRIPSLNYLSQKNILDFLNSINEKHINILEKYFNQEVYVDKINYNLVENKIFYLDDSLDLCEFSGFKDFTLTRNKNVCKITFWR